MTRHLLQMIAAGPLLALGVSATAMAQPSDFEISLERGGCYGSCPSYVVTVHRDGLVEYDGQGWVKVFGKQRGQVSPKAVQALFDKVEAAQFFKLSASYRAGITDQATYILTVRENGVIHTVEDYAGVIVGMPPAVRDLEDAVDRAVNIERWIGAPEERSRLRP